MIAVLLCSAVLSPHAMLPRASVVEPVFAIVDAETDAKITAAGRDVPKLLELASAQAAAGKDDVAKKIYRKVLEIDAANEAAHTALNHQLYDKKWFESFAELAKYKRDEAAKMKAKGLARYKEEWVPEADVPYLNMGWTKDEKGAWSNPIEAAREKQAAEWKSQGYEFRADDNSWIAPADFDKWKAIQWKCGDEWVDTAKANEFHSKLETPWELVGEHFIVWTTCEWDGGNLARWNAEKIVPEMQRIFGVAPTKKPHFVVLNSLAQYNQSAGPQPILVESEGYSSLHGAYYADAFFDRDKTPPQYEGCGVSYWDRKDQKLAGWGPFWLRWAAAQSYVEAIDPSWLAVSEWIAAGANGDIASFPGPFWAEKKIPRWLRYGAASYVERFMKNPDAASGANPWEWRAFAFDELKKAGGMRKLDDVFAFGLDMKDIPGSTRLYHEAGCVVAYLLDGTNGDKELAQKHQAFQTALKSGSKADVTTAVTALQKSLEKHERDIKKFAGL